MANQETLQEYLIKLGYSEDDAGQRRFQESIKSATTLVEGLTKAFAVAAAGSLTAIVKINQHFADLQNTARRTNTSIESLQAFGRAAELTGSSVGSMTNSLEKFSEKLRTFPKFEEWLQKWGGGKDITRDFQGNLRDSLDIMQRFARGLREHHQNWFTIVELAREAGISERDLMSLLDQRFQKFVDQSIEIRKHFKTTTQDIGDTAEEFAQKWSGFIDRLSQIATRVSINPEFMRSLEELNKFIDDNGENIIKGVDAIANAFGAFAKSVAEIVRDVGLFVTLLRDLSQGKWESIPKFFKEEAHKFETNKPAPGTGAFSSARERMMRGEPPPPRPEEKELPEKVGLLSRAINTLSDAVKGLWDRTKAGIGPYVPDTASSWWGNIRQLFGGGAAGPGSIGGVGGAGGIGGTGGGGAFGTGGGGTGRAGGGAPGGGGAGGGAGGGGTPGGTGGGTGRVAPGKGGRYSVAQAAALIRQAGGTEAEAQALGALVGQESEGNPRASNKKGEYSIGLWQINMRAHGQKYGNEEQLYDPLTNAKAALDLYRKRGNLGDWANTIKTARYQNDLAAAGEGARNPEKFAMREEASGGGYGETAQRDFKPEEYKDIPLTGGAQQRGIVSSLGGLTSGFRDRLSRMIRTARAEGAELAVKSGYRSTELQRKLFEASDRSGRMVARPGRSHHEFGTAADLSGDLGWAHRNAEKFGLHFPMSWENWHIEPTGDTDRRRSIRYQAGQREKQGSLGGAPLGHQVAANTYNSQNQSKSTHVGPFNTTLNLSPGGNAPSASAIGMHVEGAMKKVASASLANLGTKMS